MSTIQSATVEQILAATDLEQRLACLSDAGVIGPERLSTLLTRAEEMLHDHPDDSWLLADLCARFGQFPTVFAHARYLAARICAERGDLARALGLIEESRAAWRQAGRPLQALRTDLGRMQVLDDLGRHREAIEVGRRVLVELDRQPDQQADEQAVERTDEHELVAFIRATVHNNIGVARSFLGEHDNATEAYLQAERAYAQIGLEAEIAKTRANRGIELLALGQARAARDVMSAARAAFTATDDRLWAAKCAGNIAQADHLLGDLVTALRELREGRQLLLELGSETEAARLQISTAEVYLTARLHREAVEEALAAAATLAPLGLRHDAALAYFTAALGELGAGHLESAEARLDDAVHLFDEVGDAYHLARSGQVRAEIAWLGGAQTAARAEIAAACTRLAHGGWLVGLAWARLREVDMQVGERQRAALDQASETIERLSVPALRFALDVRRARRFRADGRVESAEALLRSAIADTERARRSLTLMELRGAFDADRSACYDELIDLRVAGGPGAIEEALRASLRSRAVTLADLLEGTIGRQSNVSEWSSRGLERERADLSATYHALFTTAEPGLIPTLSERAEALERQLTIHQVDRALDAIPNAPAAPQRRPVVPVGSPRPVVTYHLLSEDLLVFVESGTDVAVVRSSGVRAEIELQLDRLDAQWSRFRIRSAGGRRHRQLALATVETVLADLSRLLIEPIRNLLPTATPGSELIVVPHGRLWEVPFQALSDGSDRLLSRWSVVVAPTAVDASVSPSGGGAARPSGHRHERDGADGDAANTVKDEVDGDVLIVGVSDERTPFVVPEVEAIRSIRTGAQVLLEDEATTEALRRALPGPRLVHFACHGLFRAANPLFSALRLHDRWITAAELLELDFGGAVVVLGACESGRADPDAADPLGLAWALLCAGASEVVVSQWQVDDEASAGLMLELHRRLAGGAEVSAALRGAQLAMAGDGVHPYYWAPFSLVRVSEAASGLGPVGDPTRSRAGEPEEAVPADAASSPGTHQTAVSVGRGK